MSEMYPPPEGTDREKFTAFQIYSLHDARARDYRTILLGIMAACLALVVAGMNSLGSEKPWWVQTGFFVLAAILGSVGRFKIVTEIAEVRRRGEHIRMTYCKNRDAVPPIDSNLVGNTHEDRLPSQNAILAEPDTASHAPLR